MGDPKLVEETLAEKWETEDNDPEWITLRGESIGSFGTSLTPPHKDYERARQAAIGHRLLQVMVRASDDGAFDAGHAAHVDAIIKELRHG